MVQMRLRKADARIVVRALTSYLTSRRRAATVTRSRKLRRSLQAEEGVLESIIGGLTRGAGLCARAPREAVARPQSRRSRQTGPLTERQRQVLRLVSEGRSTKQIARVLSVSGKTVEFHRARIMENLGIRTIAELTRYAVAHGIAAP